MAQTILIGYEIRTGSFTNEKTGELVEYNNRKLRFITDSGATKDNIGFEAFTVQFKMKDLAACFRVGESDKLVDDVLNQSLHKEYELSYAPKNGEMTCVAARPKKSS